MCQQQQTTRRLKKKPIPVKQTIDPRESISHSNNVKKHTLTVQHSTENISSHNPPASYGPPPPPTSSTSASPKPAQIQQQSPGQQLADCNVDQHTRHLLIGDSVLCPVQTSLLFPRAVSQKLDIPGLTIAELVHWLEHLPHSCHVQTVVVHVGINTCWANTITESQWRQLLRLLKSVFPTARLYLSSMIPPRGQHPLWKTVKVSNAALAVVCKTEGAVFVDHTDTFYTSVGAPRKVLYKNALHPSSQGTDRLAQNIKRAVQLTDHTIQPYPFPSHRPRPSPGFSTSEFRRPALLPTPAQYHPSPVQFHPSPVQSHPSLVQHHPSPVQYHPSLVRDHFTTLQQPPKHVHYHHPSRSVHQHPTPSYYLPIPAPFTSTHSHVQSGRQAVYQPAQRYNQPPSYSDVLSRSRRHQLETCV